MSDTVFDVELLSVGNRKMGVANAIRQFTGEQVGVVMRKVNACPNAVLRDAPKEIAEALRDELVALGASVELVERGTIVSSGKSNVLETQAEDVHAVDPSPKDTVDQAAEYIYFPGKLIRLTIVNTGGEFTGGIIDDGQIIDNLQKQISVGSLNSYMEFDDGSSFESSNYTDILHAYGPHVPDSMVIIEISSDLDQSDYDRVYQEVGSYNIDDTQINQFTCANPSYDPGKVVRHSDNAIVFFTQKIEKRIHYPVVFEGIDRLVFNDIYVGSINMDESISGDEILHEVLYIPKSQANRYLREYLQTGLSDTDSLSDYLTDIYEENHPLKEIIRKNHLISPGDIEGKGEWENDYVKLLNVSGNVIFEDGAY